MNNQPFWRHTAHLPQGLYIPLNHLLEWVKPVPKAMIMGEYRSYGMGDFSMQLLAFQSRIPFDILSKGTSYSYWWDHNSLNSRSLSCFAHIQGTIPFTTISSTMDQLDSWSWDHLWGRDQKKGDGGKGAPTWSLQVCLDWVFSERFSSIFLSGLCFFFHLKESK